MAYLADNRILLGTVAVESLPRTPGNNGRQYRVIPTASSACTRCFCFCFCFCSPPSACFLSIPIFPYSHIPIHVFVVRSIHKIPVAVLTRIDTHRARRWLARYLHVHAAASALEYSRPCPAF